MIANELIFIDVETTGLDPDKDEILEVSAIKFTPEGKILEKYHHMCSPVSGKIPEEASKINGITMEKVAGMPHYMEIRPRLGEFIGKRTLIGHNIKNFDIKFLKIKPVAMEDTLEICRSIWPGKNNLESACRRLGIKFDRKDAHQAEYDVHKGIELYLALKSLLNKSTEQTSMFARPKNLPTQVYSFSRINLYNQCPFKWKMIYLLGMKEPDNEHFIVGRTIHKICEMSALWCYAETFANKFEVYAHANSLTLNDNIKNVIFKEYQDRNPFYLYDVVTGITFKHFGMYFFCHPTSTYFGKNLVEFINLLSKAVPDDKYEIVSMPNRAAYNRIISMALVKEKCTDPEMINDVQFLADFFYNQRNFSLYTGEMALVEKKLAFDRKWNLLKDWWDKNAFVRGVVDVIEYNIDYVTIIDYKSNRKMLSERELKNDPQMKMYVMLVYRYLPKGSVKRIIVKHHYIRFGKTIEYEVADPEAISSEAEQWINDSINEIEAEMLKPEAESFLPRRNEYCGSCHLMEENKCPLFNVNFINNINDPANFNIRNMDDLRTAWKKIEVNKAEIVNLTQKCKRFVNSVTERVKIDDLATLDYWTKETEDVNADTFVRLLISKEYKMSQILPFLKIGKNEFEKIQKRLKLDLTEDELKSIIQKNTRTEFKALTPKEVEDNKTLNI